MDVASYSVLRRISALNVITMHNDKYNGLQSYCRNIEMKCKTVLNASCVKPVSDKSIKSYN